MERMHLSTDTSVGMDPEPQEERFAELARRAEARDLFVLHRLAPDRFVNLDGFGRGRGWAGNLSVDPAAEPWLTRVLDLGLFRARYGFACRIFGPYWATEAAGVAVGEHLVVMGGGEVASAEDDTLEEVAKQAAEAVGQVPVAKRLADELEVTQAALAVATLPGESVEEAAAGLAARAAEALSCEFGAVLLHDPLRLFVADRGWRPAASDEEVMGALLPLRQAARDGLLVEQDTGASSLPYRPLAFEDGLVARLVVPLGERGRIGMLVVAHATGAPRGFTSLCQRVIKRIAEVAAPLLERAAV
jgi:hypothetical protein